MQGHNRGKRSLRCASSATRWLSNAQKEVLASMPGSAVNGLTATDARRVLREPMFYHQQARAGYSPGSGVRILSILRQKLPGVVRYIPEGRRYALESAGVVAVMKMLKDDREAGRAKPGTGGI